MSKDIYAQWTTECPKCRHRHTLVVFRVTLLATGETLYPETSLEPDGFIVDPECEYDHVKDQSTENEKVRCDSCREIFDLSDLYLRR